MSKQEPTTIQTKFTEKIRSDRNGNHLYTGIDAVVPPNTNMHILIDGGNYVVCSNNDGTKIIPWSKKFPPTLISKPDRAFELIILS